MPSLSCSGISAAIYRLRITFPSRAYHLLLCLRMSWRLPSSENLGVAPPKHRRTGGPEAKNQDEETMNQRMETLTKAGLQAAQNIRQFQAVTFVTFLAGLNLHCVKYALSAGATYDAEVKKAGKGHKLGSPQGHVAMAFLEGLALDVQAVSAERQAPCQVHRAYLAQVKEQVEKHPEGLTMICRLFPIFA